MKKVWCLLCLIYPSQHLSAETKLIGIVSQAKGQVFRDSRENRSAVKKLFSNENFMEHKTAEALKTGDQLFQGDKISTQEKSFAQMTLLGKTVFTLGPESSLVLNSQDFFQEKGILHSIIPHGNPDRITVKTPQASMGIRGTEFITQTGTGETYVALITGSLEIFNNGERKMMEPKHLMKIRSSGIYNIEKLSDAMIFYLKKNSVESGIHLQTILDQFMKQMDTAPALTEEPVMKKENRNKTWQEILEENQRRK